MVSAMPEVQVEQLRPDHDFMIIACDGIWDCLTSQESVDFFTKNLKLRKAQQSTAKVIEDMFDQIICKDVHAPDCDGSGTDNMTCVLIEIKK